LDFGFRLRNAFDEFRDCESDSGNPNSRRAKRIIRYENLKSKIAKAPDSCDEEPRCRLNGVTSSFQTTRNWLL
jgi:hypothetical protein